MLGLEYKLYVGPEDDEPVEDTEGWVEDWTNDDGDWDEWKDRD